MIIHMIIHMMWKKTTASYISAAGLIAVERIEALGIATFRRSAVFLRVFQQCNSSMTIEWDVYLVAHPT